MTRRALSNPHFSPALVRIREEPLRLTDGRELDTLVVAETPAGTVTEWDEDIAAARGRAISRALAGEVDAVPWADIRLRHDSRGHIRGGTVRAVAPMGCVTVWGDPVGGCTAERAWAALKRVLRGEVSCPLCGHDYLTQDGSTWACPECEREAA